jgi:hypothetical protein
VIFTLDSDHHQVGLRRRHYEIAADTVMVGSM